MKSIKDKERTMKSIKYAICCLALALLVAGCATTGTNSGSFNVEDRLEIINVLNSYSHYFDHGQTEEWLNLFTEDGTFEGEGMVFKGRAQMTPLVVRAKKWLETGVQRRHRISNIIFHEQTGSTARISAYLLLASTKNKRELSIISTGRYDGWLVKKDGDWKISKWVFTGDRKLDVPLKTKGDKQ